MHIICSVRALSPQREGFFAGAHNGDAGMAGGVSLAIAGWSGCPRLSDTPFGPEARAHCLSLRQGMRLGGGAVRPQFLFGYVNQDRLGLARVKGLK